MRRVKVQILVSVLLLNTVCAHTSPSGLYPHLGFEVAPGEARSTLGHSVNGARKNISAVVLTFWRFMSSFSCP